MKDSKSLNREKLVETIISTIVAISVGFLVGALLLGLSGYNAMSAYMVIWNKVTSDFGLVIGKATPLIFTGLAVAIPYSIGLVNLGAEGQMVMGAFVAAMLGAYVSLPAWIHVPLLLVGAAAAGLLCAAVCGVLRLKCHANEVVTTVMLNSIIILLAQYLSNGPLNGDAAQPRTPYILETAYLPKFSERHEFSSAIFIAIIAAVIIWVFLKKTVAGYEMRAAGFNMKASFYKGIDVNRASLMAMAIGGLMAGIGGACEVMGLQHNYYHGFVNNYGYTGVGVALIARNNPLAAIPAAFFLAMIQVGGIAMDRQTDIPSYFTWVLQGAIIIFLAVPNMTEHLRNLYTAVINALKKLFRKGEGTCKNS